MIIENFTAVEVAALLERAGFSHCDIYDALTDAGFEPHEDAPVTVLTYDHAVEIVRSYVNNGAVAA